MVTKITTPLPPASLNDNSRDWDVRSVDSTSTLIELTSQEDNAFDCSLSKGDKDFFLKQYASITSAHQPLSAATSPKNAEKYLSEKLVFRWKNYHRLLAASSLEMFAQELKSVKVDWSKSLLVSTTLEGYEKELKEIILESLCKKLEKLHLERKEEGPLTLPADIIDQMQQIEEIVIYINDVCDGDPHALPPKGVQQKFTELRDLLLRAAERSGIKRKTVENLELIALYAKVLDAEKSKLEALISKPEDGEPKLEAAESGLKAAELNLIEMQSRLKSKVKDSTVLGWEAAKSELEASKSKLQAVESKITKEKDSVRSQRISLQEMENKREYVYKTHEAYKAYKARQDEQKTLGNLFKRLMTFFFNPSLNTYVGLMSLQSFLVRSVRTHWGPFI